MRNNVNETSKVQRVILKSLSIVGLGAMLILSACDGKGGVKTGALDDTRLSAEQLSARMLAADTANKPKPVVVISDTTKDGSSSSLPLCGCEELITTGNDFNTDSGGESTPAGIIASELNGNTGFASCTSGKAVTTCGENCGNSSISVKPRPGAMCRI